MNVMTPDSPMHRDSDRISFFSLPLEIRNLIYENLLLSPLPLPPTPPQSEQHVWATILRTNRRIYNEAIDFLYERNYFTIHLRCALHKVAYEPFLSSLSMENASRIKEVEIVLWGNYNEDDGDTMAFGTEDFGISLQNLIYAPKMVVAIDIVKTKMEAQEEDPAHVTTNFCAFDWLMATFVDEWYFDRTFFDLFRAVACFHMKRMFSNGRIKTCHSRWFRESRATPGSKEHERRRLWELEERYGLSHEMDKDKPKGSESDDEGHNLEDEDMGSDEEDKDMASNGDYGTGFEDEEDEESDENRTKVEDDAINAGKSRS